jgi:hypothetical protein
MLWIGCYSDAPPKLTPEADTRLWVQEAYKKVDKTQLKSTFNQERAAWLKEKMDKETDPGKKLNAAMDYSYELIKCGEPKKAMDIMASVGNFILSNKIPLDSSGKVAFYSLMGIACLRLGETENCLQNHNHESCFVPIQDGGIHKLPFGSENAINQYTYLLKEFPDNLEAKYLLNLAYMTLGKYPQEVPKEYLIDPSWFESKISFPRYEEIAEKIGVNRQSTAGGVVIDDFTNDGWDDIVITAWGPTEELIFYKNNGDGSFTDETEAYGLKGHVGVLHLNQTDINNDGWLDLLLLRGAWWNIYGDIPRTLLMNTGKGKFVDVTLKAGLTKAAPSQAAAWADYNLDGWLDVCIANESLQGYDRGIDLYINQQDGTFNHESITYGLTMNEFYKGITATYANDDMYPDLYFSTIGTPNSLYINQSGKGFTKADVPLGAPRNSFPTWSFDFDNNGYEDIFVSSFNNEGTPATMWMKSHMGTADPDMFPKLYSNLGNMQYQEVGVPMGLTEVAFTMGCNFGDINTDGFLDFYLATGNPLYQALVPNKMYLNMEGKRFEDVSYAGGFANIQKGHGVSFADLDHDGDEDVYVVIGGAFIGDNYFNCLFENPNPDKNNWLVLKLEGKKANKAAIGARVAISIQENGQERMLYRSVTSGASFGANTLALELGLRKATAVNKVKVQWPCKDCPDQEFTGMEINKAYKLVEGQSSPKPIQYSAVKMKAAEGMKEHVHQ